VGAARVGAGVPAGRDVRAWSDPRLASTSAGEDGPRLERVATVLLMLLPGGLVVMFGFDAGGFFPAAQAAAIIALAQVLLVRSMLSRDPFVGVSRATLVAIAALGAYAALTLASALWSHSLGRALIEFDRALLYMLVLALFGTVRANAANLRWMIRGIALGCSIVCAAGLISRVAPDVWHTAPDVANERLSYPVTYWNALGLLATLGILFAFELTCSLAERRLTRVLAAAVLPVLAATLFFTFSRGAIAAGVVGLAAYILVARPRLLVSGALAAVPCTAALIAVAYHAKLLDTVDPTTPAATAEGHRVALAVLASAAVCAALRLVFAARLDPRLGREPHAARMSRQTRSSAIGAAAAAIIVAALVLGVPHALTRDWNRFFSGATPNGNSGDLRQRLTDPANNGRSELWTVALNGLDASPLHGSGAGTYQTLWDRNRPRFFYTVNAHSLYLEAAAELGAPGLALLAVLVGGVLVGLTARARGSQRSLYGVLLGAAVLWGVHAGVDWDWQMPVVTVPFFAIAGLALGPRGGGVRGWPAGGAARFALASICVAAMVLPALIIVSQGRLDVAKRALSASDCARAVPAARSSINWLGAQPQPYEILGFCDLRRGQPRLAVAAMREAQRRDPASWEPYYELAVAQAAAGIDPRAAAERALRMNPLEPLTLQAVKVFRGSSPTGWARQALRVRAAALASNDLSIVPS
jgi:O-antigen ligase